MYFMKIMTDEGLLYRRLWFFCYVKVASILKLFNDNKHVMFHIWKPSVRCCCCSAEPLVSSFKRSVLTEQQMKLLYDMNGKAIPGHEKANTCSTVITQYCLSQIRGISNITTDNLDITIMLTIIQTCSPNVYNYSQPHFDLIRIQRNEFAHCGTNGTMCEVDFNIKWDNLERAILAIVGQIDNSHRRYEANEINRLKNMNVSNEEISEQLKCITPEGFSRSRSSKTEKFTDVGRQMLNIRYEIFLSSPQQRRKTKIQKIIKKEMKETDETTQEYFKRIGGIETNPGSHSLSDDNDDHNISFESVSENNKRQIVKLGNHVYNVELRLNEAIKTRNRNCCFQGIICCTKNYQPDDDKERLTTSDDNETCYIKWKIETTDETIIKEVVNELEKAADYMDAPFDIKFVRMGSLILATTVKRCILQDNKVLRRAVKMFLKEILFFGEIDTTIKAVLKVEAYQLDKEKFYLENEDDSPGPSDGFERNPSFVEVSEYSSNESLPVSNNAIRCYYRNIHELNLEYVECAESPKQLVYVYSGVSGVSAARDIAH